MHALLGVGKFEICGGRGCVPGPYVTLTTLRTVQSSPVTLSPKTGQSEHSEPVIGSSFMLTCLVSKTVQFLLFLLPSLAGCRRAPSAIQHSVVYKIRSFHW